MSEGNSDNIPKGQPPVVLEMRIVAEPGKPVVVHFPLLGDKVITYGFLKLAEKTIDAHYRKMEEQIVKPVKGGMMNFARNRL